MCQHVVTTTTPAWQCALIGGEGDILPPVFGAELPKAFVSVATSQARE